MSKFHTIVDFSGDFKPGDYPAIELRIFLLPGEPQFFLIGYAEDLETARCVSAFLNEVVLPNIKPQCEEIEAVTGMLIKAIGEEIEKLPDDEPEVSNTNEDAELLKNNNLDEGKEDGRTNFGMEKE
jgi:hypothetical protein